MEWDEVVDAVIQKMRNDFVAKMLSFLSIQAEGGITNLESMMLYFGKLVIRGICKENHSEHSNSKKIVSIKDALNTIEKRSMGFEDDFGHLLSY